MILKVHAAAEPPCQSVSLFSTPGGTIREVSLPSLLMCLSAVSLSHMFPCWLKGWKIIKTEVDTIKHVSEEGSPNLKICLF